MKSITYSSVTAVGQLFPITVQYGKKDSGIMKQTPDWDAIVAIVFIIGFFTAFTLTVIFSS